MHGSALVTDTELNNSELMRTSHAGRPLFCALCGRGVDRAGCLSLFYGALHERRLASPTARCVAQEYKLLPLLFQWLYRGL